MRPGFPKPLSSRSLSLPRLPRPTRRPEDAAAVIHTHTFELKDLREAIRYAKDRVDDAIKVVVRMPSAVSEKKIAAE
jgi:hypothetical protein